jgi:hypothetical protein
MNVAAVARRLEDGGFTHEQAAILAEVLHDEVSAQIATKDHVDLVVERASERLEKMIHIKGKSTIMGGGHDDRTDGRAPGGDGRPREVVHVMVVPKRPN